jgi:hypothetical protein
MSVPIAERRALLEDLVELCSLADVDIATMFGSPAIRHRGRIVCFLSHEAALIVKLTRQEAVDLIASGDARPVVMGRRTLREWVDVPRAADDSATLERWRPHTLAAFEHARRALVTDPPV